jgi:plastocyanin
MVSGGPHNVAFDPTTLPEAAKAQINANLTEPAMELSGKYLTAPNEEYVLSFGGVPAGTYEFHCTPHLAMNMKGKVTVQ